MLRRLIARPTQPSLPFGSLCLAHCYFLPSPARCFSASPSHNARTTRKARKTGGINVRKIAGDSVPKRSGTATRITKVLRKISLEPPLKIKRCYPRSTPELEDTTEATTESKEDETTKIQRKIATKGGTKAGRAVQESAPSGVSLKEAMVGQPLENSEEPVKKKKKARAKKKADAENLPVEILSPEQLDFQPIDVEIPPVPMLAHGLDRVLFNPGVYRLQDPRSRVYNFDPYIERIMPVREFDFEALSEYKTSSKDPTLLNITKEQGIKYTGSTSSMTAVLQHFHFLLSQWRPLNNNALSHDFPAPSDSFSKVTKGPSVIFLRYRDGVYAVDADKSYETPNIMSWLGHSLEKLLTNRREDFERYRRSSPEKPPPGEETSCFHYTRLGNFLMRSQLDARDPRLPGTGVFDLKTRAVVSIRMNAQDIEAGSGYQLRYGTGEWESFEREFHDMTRSTLLKYSLQARMGRMDGIFVAYHNIDTIFGFQYLSVPDMDAVLHGQSDTTLGDHEFKLSVRLLDELLQRATEKFPKTSLRLHFETRQNTVPYMYVFAEPVTEEEADAIQDTTLPLRKAFERDIIGVNRDDPEVQEVWQEMQEQIDEEMSEEERNESEEVSKEENSEERRRRTDEAIEEETAENEAEPLAAKESSVSQEETEDATLETTSEESQKTPDIEAGKDTDQVTADDLASTSANQDEQENSSNPRTPGLEPSSNLPLLAGWTLTIRNRVNGTYVPRPTNLTADDDWSVEYLIKDIDNTATKSRVYQQIKNRRQSLIGKSEEERAVDMARYRAVLKKYSVKGREWRQEQDRIDEEMGRRVYRPLGPGAEDVAKVEEGASKEGSRP